MSSDPPSKGTPEYVQWLRATLTPEDLDALPASDVEALRRFGRGVEFRAGELLFSQGEKPHVTYIIESGEAELVYETRFERLVVQLLGPGSGVGYLAVVLDSPYAYSAYARTAVRGLAFDTATVDTMLDLHPEICFRWLRLLAKRLERAQRRLVEFAGKSAFERVVHFLLNETLERDSLSLSLTQSKLAEVLALSRQTVSRVLGDLESQRLIECRRGLILITDRNSLRDHVPR